MVVPISPPPKTLYQIVVCVQFYLETQGFSWKILEDDRFKELKFTLDNLMKAHTSQGLGVSVRKADIISKTDEDILWNSGVLGSNTPEKLLYTVLYLVGLNCALHAAKEHCNLRSKQGQFSCMFDDHGTQFLRYHEDVGNETNKGGLKNRKCDPRVVDVYGIPNSPHCPLAIIAKYLALVLNPRSCTAFYLQPLSKYTPVCWYQDNPVGINKLQ